MNKMTEMSPEKLSYEWTVDSKIYRHEEQSKIVADFLSNQNHATFSKLIEMLKPMLISYSTEFSRKYKIPFRDLYNTSLIGVLKAAQKYNPKAAIFSSYVRWWIINKLQNEVRLYHNISSRRFFVYKKIEEVKKDFRLNGLEDPTDTQLAEKLSFGEATIKFNSHLKKEQSIEIFANEQGEYNKLLPFLENDSEQNTIQTLDRARIREVVHNKIKSLLNSNQYSVFYEYFYNDRTCSEIAKERGVTSQSVHFMLKTSLSLIKRRLGSFFSQFNE